MLIASIRGYQKYNHGFRSESRYQIKLKICVLVTNLPGKTSLITTEHSKLQSQHQSLKGNAKSKKKQTKPKKTAKCRPITD